MCERDRESARTRGSMASLRVLIMNTIWDCIRVEEFVSFCLCACGCACELRAFCIFANILLPQCSYKLFQSPANPCEFIDLVTRTKILTRSTRNKELTPNPMPPNMNFRHNGLRWELYIHQQNIHELWILMSWFSVVWILIIERFPAVVTQKHTKRFLLIIKFLIDLLKYRNDTKTIHAEDA
jgi:hypothetical protein